jgi:hypothetical protein
MKRSVVFVFALVGVLGMTVTVWSLGAGSEQPNVVTRGEGEPASCDVFNVKYRCANCHDPFGKGPQRANLTPMGLEYQAKQLGCIANAKAVAAHAAQGPTHNELLPGHEDRMGLVREHFVAFNCQKCHDVEGNGKTPSNLLLFGLDMHVAGKGCIQCSNAIKAKAGRTDLLPAPHYAKE